MKEGTSHFSMKIKLNRINCLPAPCPDTLLVFIPLPFNISTISQRNADISCLISFTSSSVTPCDSALRCSTVTYRRTRFRIICWKRQTSNGRRDKKIYVEKENIDLWITKMDMFRGLCLGLCYSKVPINHILKSFTLKTKNQNKKKKEILTWYLNSRSLACFAFFYGRNKERKNVIIIISALSKYVIRV